MSSRRVGRRARVNPLQLLPAEHFSPPRQAAVSGYDTVEEDTIYAVTGNPRPAEVAAALDQLLTGEYVAVYECE